MNRESRKCQNCHQEFWIEPDDFGFYETIHVPPPTWCPECRFIRRIAAQGYRVLYKRKCDFTGDMVISVHSPDLAHKIYRQDIWWSDKWDSRSYGRDYDFSRSFFEQFHELLQEVPFPSLYSDYTTMINSEYCNAAGTLKNCYLCFKADHSEDCAYLNTIQYMKDCFDVSFSNNCELCYGSVTINKCYRTFYSQDCEDCHDVWFSRDLIGCSSCVGCINLRNKNYHIFNKPYSKEEYERLVGEFNLGSMKNVGEFKKKVNDFILRFPRKEFHGRKNTNSSGDYIFNCKNVQDSFMVRNGENCRYCQLLKNGPVAQSYDYTMFADKAEWIYESSWTGINVNNVKFGEWVYRCHDVEYCFGCHGSGNIFGCVGIRNSEYCILNKQYSKDEYQDKVRKIKKQMTEIPYRDKLGREYRYGELFPAEFLPWAYNESTAYEWDPLSKEEALKKGFRWRDPDLREYQDATVSVPDHIKDVTDDILKGILKCVKCGKNYKLIKSELNFYRRFQIPVPQECPLCRDYARVKKLNPMKLHNRECAKCKKNIRTTYVPDRPETIYCEECYQREVV